MQKEKWSQDKKNYVDFGTPTRTQMSRGEAERHNHNTSICEARKKRKKIPAC